MSIFNDVMVELKLTYKEIQNNEMLGKFVIDYTKRKYEQCWIQRWNGNAVIEINKHNGTSIRTVLTNEEYKPEYPENIDLNISNKCNIKKFIEDKNSFLYSMQAGSKLTINGNEPLHKDLELLLTTCKSLNILANLIVNEITLLNNKNQIEEWLHKGLIHNIGISPKDCSKEMIEWCADHSNVISFDNLALSQLDIQSILNKDEWNLYGRGEDGNPTFYIDLVNELYYKDNTSKEGKPLLNDVRKMLNSFKEVDNEI